MFVFLGSLYGHPERALEHIMISTLICTAVDEIHYRIYPDSRLRRRAALAVGVTAFAGLGKELYDEYGGPGYFSINDIFADLFGCAFYVAWKF